MCKGENKYEMLTNGTRVNVSEHHKFGADALLLAHFCNVKRAEHVCDLCTGNGIIPLKLYDRGHRGSCLAIDIMQDAIELLQQSVLENSAENISAVRADLRTLLPRRYAQDADVKTDEQKPVYNTQFDVVTCNPPYFTAGFQSPKSVRASARHEGLCDINDVCRAASVLLKDGGRLCICMTPQRTADVICAMREARIEPKRIQYVTAQVQKEPWLVLIEGQKNRAPGARILPQIITENPDGTRPSPAMREIYES